MNVITISNLDQLNVILNDLLCLSGKPSEEIDHNMWCISLEGNLIESITLKQLKGFVDKLLENRKLQLKDNNLSQGAIFYMWFDQQTQQLRFNVITNNAKLPFECEVQLYATPEFILNNFINTVRDISQHGDRIEFFDGNDWLDEDQNEKEYVLDVFSKIL